jgi:hypothetical protein
LFGSCQKGVPVGKREVEGAITMKSTFLLLLLLAGCAGNAPTVPASSPSTTQAPAPGSCEALLQALDPRACVEPAVLSLDFSGCVEMRFVVRLSEVVYDLPPGYVSSQSAGSPQQVEVSLARCEQMSRGDTSFGPMGFASVSVLIEPVDHGQGEVFFDQYLVETLASSSSLHDALQGLGYPAVWGNVTVVDSGNTRTGRAGGDVEYNATGVVTGERGAHVEEQEGNHIAGQRWYVTGRDCQYYSLTAPVELTAQKGALAQAMPAAGPLAGSGSQAMSCDMNITFGRSSQRAS